MAFNIWFSNLCIAYMFLIPTHLTFYVSYQNILLHYVMSSMIYMHTCCCTCIIGVLSFVPNVKTSALYTLSRNLFCYVIRMSTLIFFYIIIKIFIKCFFYFFNFAICPGPNFVFFLCMNRQKHSHSKANSKNNYYPSSFHYCHLPSAYFRHVQPKSLIWLRFIIERVPHSGQSA